MRLQIMPMPDSIPPELAKAAPGLIGSILALRWINGTPLQRIATAVGGASGSYYGADWLAELTGIQGGFAAWLLGLFGMAIAHKVFEGIAGMDIGKRVDKILAKFGL